MSNAIFSVDGNGTLTELSQTDFENEALFQELLATHPAVLGLTTGVDDKLLLIKREQGVPDTDGAGGRWSLDHLFVDSQGVPVLVEVKRASDSRARREVVAQMLDYAANGVAYWPIATLIASFENAAKLHNEEPEVLLSHFIGANRTPEDFWKQVEANLRSGRIRMVFVADSIPKELRRIVEFMNEQMSPADVLAVEVRNYVSAKGDRTLVPSLVGATERASANKSAIRQQNSLHFEDWVREFNDRYGAEASAGLHRALTFFESHKVDVVVSSAGDSVTAKIPTKDNKLAWPFFIRRSTGNFEISLQNLKSRPAYSSDVSRLALLEKVKQLPGVSVATSKATGWPAFPVALLIEEELWSNLAPMIETIMTKAQEA